MIESPLAAIPLTGRINERELAGMAHDRGVRVAQGEEALLDRNRNLLGKADPDEAAGRQRVAITDELHRLRSGDHLSFLVALEKGQGGMLDHLGSRFRLLHNARLPSIRRQPLKLHQGCNSSCQTCFRGAPNKPGNSSPISPERHSILIVDQCRG